MSKALIIGAAGFAGTALRSELINNGYEVVCADVMSDDDSIIKVDMLDSNSADKLIEDVCPDMIFNLAGQASPFLSWQKIALTMHLNVDLSVNICESVARHCPNCRILFIGSANQYDMTLASQDGLVSESTPLTSDSPYSISKNTQEAILKLLAKKYNLDIVSTRSFNHIGPNQKPGFVITDYCMRIAKLEKGELDGFNYGNLDSWRDFSDVRDVVRAYRLIAEKGRSGEIYNVGSGKSFYIRDLIGALVDMSPIAAQKTTLPPRLDDDKLVHYRSDNRKLYEDTGFEPCIDILKDTIPSVLDAYREKVSEGLI
mgnify:CR=1 FL=1